jgi:glucuronokinase
MKVRTRAPSRAGLAGNPSDGYGGRALAVAITGFAARATIEPASRVEIRSVRDGRLERDSLSSLAERASIDPGDPHRLAIACCRHFLSEAPYRGWLDTAPRPHEGFLLQYETDIPERVGLAGSSALAVAILRALALRYGATIPEEDLPTLALEVETRELHIHGGLMDRVAQVLGGVTYVDLSDSILSATGRGRYEQLPADRLPALFVAWHPGLAAGSESVHNRLRERVARGDPQADAILRDLAGLADEARQVMVSGSPEQLAPLMDANFELRARLVEVGDGNRRLVETGRQIGAGVKQAGSGGAVVGAFDGDPSRLENLRLAYKQIGARFLVPRVWTGPTDGSTRA